MKTYKHLWNDFISDENLFLAVKKSENGKRWKEATLGFNYNYESEIFRLQRELKSGVYLPGNYNKFTIKEPKERDIYAAPYRDRVLHHALINIIEPIWEPRLYYHSYACRTGKGSHRALDVCQKYLRKNKYVLKSDIQKYFPSIDHTVLKTLIRKKIADTRLLKLIDLIIDTSPGEISLNVPFRYFEGDNLFTPGQNRRGIPIGNLTSQFFANIYLHELDKYIKEELRQQYYLRYMDDFLIFNDSKAELKQIRIKINKFLNTLRLTMHPKKQEIDPAKNGIPFLGFHIYREFRRLQKKNIRLFLRRMKIKQKQYADYEIDLKDIKQSLVAWNGHSSHGDTYHLREQLLNRLTFQRVG